MLPEHEIEIQVRYHETDGQGHVHHANYLHYFELGRVELLRSIGRDYADLERDGIVLVVTGIQCRYLRPCRFGDTLRLRTVTVSARGARLRHRYQLLRGGELLAEAESTVACIDPDGRVQRLPDWLREECRTIVPQTRIQPSMPALETETPRRIYLDNAATSWPKPEAVYEAMDRYAREVGAPAGRSAYRHAAEAERIVESARVKVARLIDSPEPSSVVFAFNGSDALNMALHGVLRPGDHVVTSRAEHNSVLRPLAELRRRIGIKVSYVPVDAEGCFSADDVLAEVKSHTRLVVLVHASNVTGAVQPLEEVGGRLGEWSALFLVDAAQSLGHRPVSVRELQADLLAAPGHKGLLGPLGTGILYVRPEVADQVASFRQGGTGTLSEQEDQPLSLPQKYESGNHNVLGLAGLGAALDYLLAEGSVERIQAREAELTERLLAGLSDIPGIRVHGPGPAVMRRPRLGVVSISAQGYDPQDLAAMLDSAAAVQTRAGLHCAPRMHAALGTLATGGTLRFSLGHANTSQDVDQAVSLVGQAMAAAEIA